MTINRFTVNCEPVMEQTADDTEHNLLNRAKQLAHQNSWEIGELAAEWHQRYAKGRTDAFFGDAIGLTEDQVYQRRRVWELFGKRRAEFTHCRWSHFREAISWDDALECLEWAESSEATTREMSAWRKAKRGEPLFDVPQKPSEKPEGRTVHRDTTPKPKEALKPIERPAEPELTLVTAPKVVDPAVSDNSKVDEAIQQASGLIQYVVKHGSPQDRARLAGVLGPLLDGIRGSGR